MNHSMYKKNKKIIAFKMNNKLIRLLLFEDNPGDVRLIREQLIGVHDRFELHYAESLAKGLDFLASNNIDAVLLDLELPDSHGLNTIKLVLAKILLSRLLC